MANTFLEKKNYNNKKKIKKQGSGPDIEYGQITIHRKSAIINFIITVQIFKCDLRLNIYKL